MKIIKGMLLLMLLVKIHSINAQSSFTNYLNNLPVLAEHSNYRNFEFKDDEEAGTDIFESVLPNKNYLIKAHFDAGESREIRFDGSSHIIVGRYTISDLNHITTLLTRRPGFPASYELINIRRNGTSHYTVVESLDAYDSYDGEPATFFAIRGSKILIYFIGETFGIGATYTINSVGHFALTDRQVFEEENYQGVFNYPGN